MGNFGPYDNEMEHVYNFKLNLCLQELVSGELHTLYWGSFMVLFISNQL